MLLAWLLEGKAHKTGVPARALRDVYWTEKEIEQTGQVSFGPCSELNETERPEKQMSGAQ